MLGSIPEKISFNKEKVGMPVKNRVLGSLSLKESSVNDKLLTDNFNSSNFEFLLPFEKIICQFVLTSHLDSQKSNWVPA